MNVTLDELKLDYQKELQKLANNINIVKSLRAGFPHPYTKQDAIGFITAVAKDSTKAVFAVLYNQQFAGVIGLHDINKKNAELGYWLGEPFWGKKIISNAIALILNVAKNNFNLTAVYAYSLKNNIASYKAMEKNGFQYVKTVDTDCNQLQANVPSLYYEITF